MTYEQAHARLLNHASLLFGREPLPDEESLHFNLFMAEQKRTPPARLESLYADILSCLEVVNRTLNGATPSESTNGKSSVIERVLAYAMWTLIDDSWKYYRRWEVGQFFERQILEQLARTAWGISCAWGAVLAGDIDSVGEHVELEEAARGITN